MAFCTKCGTNVTGAFCNQCGTPAAGVPVAAPGPYTQPMAAGAPPVARKTSPVVWILVAILGLFLLGGVAIVGVAAFVTHRARQAGLEFGRGHNGGITFQARGGDGKDARIEFGTSSKLPSWVPVYPGSDATPTFAIKASGDGGGEGGNFTFTTADSRSHVKEFYQSKFKDLGMKMNLETNSDEGGMMIATDESNAEKRSLTVVVAEHLGLTTVNVTYGLK